MTTSTIFSTGWCSPTKSYKLTGAELVTCKIAVNCSLLFDLASEGDIEGVKTSWGIQLTDDAVGAHCASTLFSLCIRVLTLRNDVDR